MDYKIKYNNALEGIRELYNSDCDMIRVNRLRRQLKRIFPELQESEDEKIRKELIAIYSVGAKVNAKTGDIPDKDIVAWLEKQGEQKSSNIPSRETILAVWELGNDWKELTNGSISTEYGTQLEYIQKHWQESSYYNWEEVTNES